MENQNKDSASISENLIAYLRDKLNSSAVDYASPLTQLKGGNETYIYRFELSGVQGDLAKPLVLRLYPQFYGPWNAGWESTIQNLLASEGYPVPKAHFVCTDMAILGGAFFIMEFLPGEPLIREPLETVPGILGKAHATLHRIDPASLIEKFDEQGISGNRYRFAGRLHRLNERKDEMPWIAQGVDWLVEHRPPEPQRPAVCHGDFHPLNILTQAGEVTAVLDWPGFIIADPAYDVAHTMMLITIPFKHLSGSSGLASIDWDAVAQRYLDAYRAQSPLETDHLDYYRAKRCLDALIEGHNGQEIWRHPPIETDLIETIRKVTGVDIITPGGKREDDAY